MKLAKVSDQPAAVKTSVGEFVQVLVEALAIVLLVSFFSLGVRTGMVVALEIRKGESDSRENRGGT